MSKLDDEHKAPDGFFYVVVATEEQVAAARPAGETHDAKQTETHDACLYLWAMVKHEEPDRGPQVAEGGVFGQASTMVASPSDHGPPHSALPATEKLTAAAAPVLDPTTVSVGPASKMAQAATEENYLAAPDARVTGATENIAARSPQVPGTVADAEFPHVALAAAASVLGGSQVCNSGGALLSTDFSAAPLEREISALEVGFANVLQRALLDVDTITTSARGRVIELRRSVEAEVGSRRDDLKSYLSLARPATYEELLHRNSIRSRLDSMAQKTEDAIVDALDYAESPDKAMDDASNYVLPMLDAAIRRLTAMRVHATQSLDERKAALTVETARRCEDISAVAKCVAEVDEFVQRWQIEVQAETLEGRDVYNEKIEQLEEDEARYVRANDTPSHNPAFAEVQASLSLARERIREQKRRASLLAQRSEKWAALRAKLPKLEMSAQPAGGMCSTFFSLFPSLKRKRSS
jgi:hypothetical protein